MHTKLSPMASLFLFIFLASLTVGSAGDQNPLTQKSYLIRYWNKQTGNSHTKPVFLLSKASPLSADESASFAKLASSHNHNALSSRLSAFCASANLLCFPDSSSPTHTDAICLRYSINCPPPLDTADQRSHTTGIFFRESMLKKGTVMPMWDIKDKLPERSFLPRSISSKLPFSTSKISELKRVFHAGDNSTMETMIVETLTDCEKAPGLGETKRCVGSAEDMIDFAVSVLGSRNVAIRTTKNANGSKQSIMIGSVKGINGGKVMQQSLSCHQSLFPYLVYYCHSVPKVRVYEADILDPNSKAKINHGVAVCHLNTSSWDPNHEAFLELGSGPGRIEVCHWIFENDLTWTVAD
ncbi:polygalacturonase-1 non-catalytic subunit beta-like [Quercus robur]|uniref:polygalacturonase-1 non-catalytic subunit beta-like n=1 Tax=Quercus robur TaxID=38942 RepID=UPI0021626296|nr:polygalacturonase-1 non-catalytic subunit beta-like [Quercus robur]XP_050260929.1 polygalacturonase-1 non-catalytic subunit beta-like [Quercus robur]XP_050260930.1 polygalacturonase-1 non-catalytic subunit beta-like [Quercus robur]XP_050260931.1 polygalacturonase-1 non-catalytic subunit beta-like [Quercus robur]